jgi:hypothetical protein
MYFSTIASTILLAASAAAHFVVPNDDQNMTGVVVNGIPYSTRVKYMRLVHFPFIHRVKTPPNPSQANEALFEQSGPCPFAAYGTIIVNHTSDSIVCRGANFRTGDPTIHGEISAINACTAVFAKRNMTATQIFAAWADLSICMFLKLQCLHPPADSCFRHKRRILPHVCICNPVVWV